MDTVVVFPGIVFCKHGCGCPLAQTVQCSLQFLRLAQIGRPALPAVLQNPQLQDAGGGDPVAAAPCSGFVPPEHAPDARDIRHLIPQNPFVAHRQSSEPLAVPAQVIVHHGKQFIHRRRFLRVGQLLPDGPGQLAFFRAEGIPQAGISQIPGHQQSAHCQQTGSRQLDVLHVIPAGFVHRPGKGQIGCTGRSHQQSNRRPHQQDQPSAGTLQAISFRRAVRLLLFVPPHQQQNHRDSKNPQQNHQQNIDHQIPGPFEVHPFFRFVSFHPSKVPFASCAFIQARTRQ